MKKSISLSLIFLCFFIIGSAQSVTIGSQVWMSKNLDVDKFRNGDPIPEARTNEEWERAGKNKQPAWCYYGNNPANGKKYGRLYNWYAIIDPRGLAPEGWHVPSENEWLKLIDYLGGKMQAGNHMKSQSGWDGDGNGSDSSRFSALPGGTRDFAGVFREIGNGGTWWSSDSIGDGLAATLDLQDYTRKANIFMGCNNCGFSVRCVRDL